MVRRGSVGQFSVPHKTPAIPRAVDADTTYKCRTIKGLWQIHSHRSPPGVKEPDGERLAADVRDVNAERAEDRIQPENAQTELERLKKDFEKYSGLDPEEARKAMDTVKNLDLTKLS